MDGDMVVFWDVDTQRDFMEPGGALYVPRAEKLIPNLKRLVDAARTGPVVLISDACVHSPDDEEFRRWPPHCLRGTRGAEMIPETLLEKVQVIPNDPQFRLPKLDLKRQLLLEKQTLDVFDNPHTVTVLDRLDRDAEFFVFGVVTEYCVRLAAKGLLERGHRVSLVTDAIETLKPEDGMRAIEELVEMGARLVTTDQALAILKKANVAGKARR